MSLKFFFNRKGSVVLSLTILGWILNLWALICLPGEMILRGKLTTCLFILYLCLCFLVTFIRFYPWYPTKDRGAALEEHFEKTLVPTAYIMVVVHLFWFLTLKPWPFLIFVCLLFLPILAVNAILLTFHFQDQDPTPPAYFSRSLYLSPEK